VELDDVYTSIKPTYEATDRIFLTAESKTGLKPEEIFADVTGGTKIMSIAVALACLASMVTAKPAMRGRLKTGHVEWPKTGVVLPCRTEFGKAGFGCAVTC
jgi:hypothetical protein